MAKVYKVLFFENNRPLTKSIQSALDEHRHLNPIIDRVAFATTNNPNEGIVQIMYIFLIIDEEPTEPEQPTSSGDRRHETNKAEKFKKRKLL